MTCFKKMRFRISVKVGIWKQKHFFYKKIKKVQKKWSKIGSRKVRIVTLKATFWPSFFGTPKNPCFKVPVDSSMRDTFIYPSQKSQNLRTNIEHRTNERKLELSHYERKGASRKNLLLEIRWFPGSFIFQFPGSSEISPVEVGGILQI